MGKISNLLNDLLSKNLISEEQSDILTQTSNSNQETLKKYLLGKGIKRDFQSFPPEIRSFAMNLQFYSPKGYSYVRDIFKNRLPHQRTIRKWLQTSSCEPGFTSESFRALEKAVNEANLKNQKLICNLVFDEMAIRERIEWAGNKSYGYVDFGNGCESNVKATQVIVFMLVCINRSWKLPIGYFPISSITAEQKSNLLTHCIETVMATGVEISGVTFDGAPSNITLARIMGCDLNPQNSEFCIKIENSSKTFPVFLDPCHMLKLVRNSFAEISPLMDSEGRTIDWQYIVKLQNLQEKEGLRLAKVRKAHVYFQKEKMKVRLATQLLSKSVADALDFCRKELKLPEFQGSEGTAHFIRVLNDAFDILNSRKITDLGLKRALSKSNFKAVSEKAAVCCNYLSTLKLPNGSAIVSHRRKLGFVGLIVCLKNLSVLHKNFLENQTLHYIPMYKLNQDHVELFFSSLRSRLGYNNNPTVRQLQASYKQLLIHCQIREGGIGNCLPLEIIEILNCPPVQPRTPLESINSSTERSIMLDNIQDESDGFNEQAFLLDHDYLLSPSSLSIYCRKVVEYVAGFIVFRLQKALQCLDCLAAIEGNVDPSSLIAYKTLGYLKNPAKSVVTICETVEAELRKVMLESAPSSIVLNKRTFQSIIAAVQRKLVGRNLFESIKCAHYCLLIKLIIEKYLHVRFHYISKLHSEKDSVRNMLTRTILFRHM